MPRSVIWIVRLVVAAWGAVLFFWWCVLPFRCNRAIRDVHLRSTAGIRSSSESRTEALAQSNIAQLTRDCRRCVNVNIDLLTAYNTEAMGRNDETLRHLDHALSLEPRPEIYFDRGMTHVAMRELDAAVEDFATAARFSPSITDTLDPALQDRVKQRAELPQ